MRLSALALAAAAIPAPAPARAETPQALYESLLSADRAFSAMAARANLAAAYSTMLDRDAMVMQPETLTIARGPADALTALAARRADFTARATWMPIGGGLSADGRHGFTYGYTILHDADGTGRPGKYLSYWIRRPQGWRVAFYRRVERPAGEVDLTARAPILPPRLLPPLRAPRPGTGESLAAAERAFSDDAQRIGLGPAFQAWGTQDAAFVGRHAAFQFGAQAIGADMPATVPARLAWASEGVLVASSGDLGVSWGWIRRNGDAAAPAFPFFTVWRRASADSPWRYVAE